MYLQLKIKQTLGGPEQQKGVEGKSEKVGNACPAPLFYSNV